MSLSPITVECHFMGFCSNQAAFQGTVVNLVTNLPPWCPVKTGLWGCDKVGKEQHLAPRESSLAGTHMARSGSAPGFPTHKYPPFRTHATHVSRKERAVFVCFLPGKSSAII